MTPAPWSSTPFPDPAPTSTTPACLGYWARPGGRPNQLRPWLLDGPYDVDAATTAILEADHYDTRAAYNLEG